MARLTFAAHLVLNGDAFVPATYQGGRIASLANLYVGTAHERDSDGSSQTAWLNMIDGIAQAARNASKAAVYKDSADTALQFSVDAFNCWLGSILCTYAGGTAVASVTAGATRHIWADLSNAPTVTIAVGASWPTTVPHLRLGSIAAPASGHWLPTDLTPVVHQQAVYVPGKTLRIFELDFVFGSGTSTLPIITLPIGARVRVANVYIDTLFNGSGPTASIGDSGSATRFMSTAVAAIGATGWKVGTTGLGHEYAAMTTVNVYLTLSGASTGAGTAIIEAYI